MKLLVGRINKFLCHLTRAAGESCVQGAHAKGAETHWGNQTALVNADVRGGRCAPTGYAGVTHAVGGARARLSMIFTATTRGETHWMFVEDAFSSDKIIDFPEDLAGELGSEVFPDPGQPGRASKQTGEGLAGRTSGAVRGVLPAGLQAGTESG